MDTMTDLNPMTLPATGLSAGVLEARSTTAPTWAVQGTRLPVAGDAAAFVAAPAAAAVAHVAELAVAGVRSTDLPGPVPRGAPV